MLFKFTVRPPLFLVTLGAGQGASKALAFRFPVAFGGPGLEASPSRAPTYHGFGASCCAFSPIPPASPRPPLARLTPDGASPGASPSGGPRGGSSVARTSIFPPLTFLIFLGFYFYFYHLVVVLEEAASWQLRRGRSRGQWPRPWLAGAH